MSASGFSSAAFPPLMPRRHLLGLALACALALFAITGSARAQHLRSSTRTQEQTGQQLLGYLQAKQLDQAISLGQEAVARWPQNADFHHWLGIAYFQSGRNAEALEELGRAAELRPG